MSATDQGSSGPDERHAAALVAAFAYDQQTRHVVPREPSQYDPAIRSALSLLDGDELTDLMFACKSLAHAADKIRQERYAVARKDRLDAEQRATTVDPFSSGEGQP